MFENYRPGVQIGNNCGCHKPQIPGTEHQGPVNITRDELGNITKLQWSPDARFSINLTSETNISIIEGSQILNKSGLTPTNIAGWEGLYAYNIVDSICWKYSNNNWVKLPNIVTSPTNNVVVTFGNDSAKTRVCIKNFRGETIFSDENNGSFVPLNVDDNLANVLKQGFYHVDIYQITLTATKLVRHIPLSISNSRPENKPPIINTVHCHDNKGFATDNTLTLQNGILSVNVSNNCEPGGTLPISSNAVFEYAQPRNIIVEVDLSNNTATLSAHDIYNYIMFGGNVQCLVSGRYLEFVEGTLESVTFKYIDISDNKASTYVVRINDNAAVEYKETQYHLDSIVNIDELKSILFTRMDALDEEHDSDINSLNESMTEMEQLISSIQNQIGDLQVTEKIVELYNNYNVLNTSVKEIDEKVEDKVSINEVSTIVNNTVSQQVSDERLQELIDKSIAENINLDGGVVED